LKYKQILKYEEKMEKEKQTEHICFKNLTIGLDHSSKSEANALCSARQKPRIKRGIGIAA
jgi:hypothetical protein